jgi:hypothetical protein
MSRIREVWAPNLETEMRNIRDVIEKYPYVAMVSSTFCTFLSPQLTPILGHGVSWRGGTTNWHIQDVIRLSLPDNAL